MNLQPINPPLRPGQRVQCAECRKMVLSAKADAEKTGRFICSLCEFGIVIVPLVQKESWQ